MKKRRRGLKTATQAAPARKAIEQKTRKQKTRQAKSAKGSGQGGDLERTLSLIRKHPGIRPSELNRLLKREESDALRGTLIKRGLIRKEKDGSAMRYYPV